MFSKNFTPVLLFRMSEIRPSVKFPSRPVDPVAAAGAPAKSDAEVKAMLASLGYTLPAGGATGSARADGVVIPAATPAPQAKTVPASAKQGRLILSAVAATVVLTGGFLFQTLVVASGTSMEQSILTVERPQIVTVAAREGAAEAAPAVATLAATPFAAELAERPATVEQPAFVPVPAPAPVAPVAVAPAAAPVATAAPAIEPAVAEVPERSVVESFVANLRISAVVPPRVMVNDKVLTFGAAVDATSGVMLHSVDTDNRLVIFNDAFGRLVARRY